MFYIVCWLNTRTGAEGKNTDVMYNFDEASQFCKDANSPTNEVRYWFEPVSALFGEL